MNQKHLLKFSKARKKYQFKILSIINKPQLLRCNKLPMFSKPNLR